MFAIKGTAIPFGPVQVGGGYSLGLFGIVIALMSLGPLVFNQFAVDRAGLTLEFLAPISTRELLYGKALGGAAIAAAPCALAVSAGVFTGAHAPLPWLLVLLGACASYAITAPVAAVLSSLFPRAVDLSSVGQGSNAHQAAGLLGFLAFAASCVPPIALTLVSWRVLHSSAAAVGLLALWLAVSLVLSWAGFRIAERLLDERRENLAMVAQGR
jgi:MFS family permease